MGNDLWPEGRPGQRPSLALAAALFAGLAASAPSPLWAQSVVEAEIVDPSAFVDELSAQTPVSGSPIAGIALVGAQAPSLSGGLFARLPAGAAGVFCLRMRSKNGAYRGALAYRIGDGDGPRAARLDYPTRHQDVLNAFAAADDLAPAVTQGDCDADRDDPLYVPASFAPPTASGQTLRIYLNSRDASTATLTLTTPDGRTLAGPAPCVKDHGARTVFDFRCDAPLPPDAPGLIDLVVDRTKRGLKTRPFRGRVAF